LKRPGFSEIGCVNLVLLQSSQTHCFRDTNSPVICSRKREIFPSYQFLITDCFWSLHNEYNRASKHPSRAKWGYSVSSMETQSFSKTLLFHLLSL